MKLSQLPSIMDIPLVWVVPPLLKFAFPLQISRKVDDLVAVKVGK